MATRARSQAIGHTQVAVGLVIMGTCVMAACLGVSRGGGSTAPSADHHSALVATDTPDPRVSGPFLGGTWEAFHSTFTHFADIYTLYGMVAGYHVSLVIAVESGTDLQARVRRIEVTGWDQPTTDALLTAITTALLPPDAHYVENVVGTGVDNWLRHVYYSPSIAASFRADGYAYDFGGTPPPPPNNAEWYCKSYYSLPPDQCVVTT